MLRRREVRCICSRRPLLGVLVDGVDEEVRPYFHIKSYKASRLYTENELFDGELHVRCRDCMRWHMVIMHEGNFKIEQMAELPDMLDAPTIDAVTSAPR